MKSTRVRFTQDEVDFLVKEAKRHNPENIQRSGKAAAHIHRTICESRKWPRRTTGSIAHKLYRIQHGYEAYPGFHDTVKKLKPGMTGKRVVSFSDTETAWDTYSRRIKEAADRFQEEKIAAKEELLKSL